LPLENLYSFLEHKLLTTEGKYRDFFPAMGDLVRDGVELAHEHHNTPCTSCCRTRPAAATTPEDCHMAPSPAPDVEVTLVVSRGALRGWEEQGAKTCAAASIAGALNTIFTCAASSAEAGGKPTRDEEKDGGGAATDGLAGVGAAGANDKDKDKAREKEGFRVLEQDVMDYYVRCVRELQTLVAPNPPQ